MELTTAKKAKPAAKVTAAKGSKAKVVAKKTAVKPKVASARGRATVAKAVKPSKPKAVAAPATKARGAKATSASKVTAPVVAKPDPRAKVVVKPALRVATKPTLSSAPRPVSAPAKGGKAVKVAVPAAVGTGIKSAQPQIAALPTPMPSKPSNVVPTMAPIRAIPKASLPAKPEKAIAYVPKTLREGGLLSEADLMKQSKSEYMSKAQLAFFKHRLADLGAELRNNAGATTEHLRELSIVPDPADRATLEEEHALELRARDRERKLLKKVEAALLRIADGSYGYCEETGDSIGIARLLARPTATLTIEAQERRELKQKMFGE